jgi:hypothetical protein
MILECADCRIPKLYNLRMTLLDLTGSPAVTAALCNDGRIGGRQ